MKVLVVSRPLLLASYRQKLTELARLGVEVTAVVPERWREGESVQVLEPSADDNYRIVVTEVRFSGRFHTHYYPRLSQIIRAERPDLVHLDEEPYNLATFLGTRASRRAGIPSVFFTWQNIFRRYPLPFRALERSVYRSTAHALAGSDEAAHILRAKGFPAAITVVPQFGVDPERFHPGPSNLTPFTIGFLNRLVEAKGPMIALDALAAIPGDVRMLMIGDGPMRTQIHEAVEARGLQQRVELRPRVPSTEMPELLRGLGVVILPSLTTSSWKEQFGRVLIEAMACGVPVVGSDSGEIPNVIGDAGCVVAERDPVALAHAIVSIRDDAAVRLELIRRGRARVLERFTQRRVAEQTRGAYIEALSGRESG